VKPAEIEALLPYLTAKEREELYALLAADKAIWRPLPGPQAMAYYSEATIIGYGGAAGGGKTDLACGKTLTQHRKAMLLRRVGTELTGILDRFEELLGGKDGYNGKDNIWRLKRRDGVPLQIEFGAVPNAGDERKFQGRPHDLLVFDEATNFLISQIRFLLGWLRTTVPGQRCQALLTFNPPTSAEGRWVIDFFAPWLDPKYPNRAQPGEIRYAASLPMSPTNPNGKDLWVDGPEPFVLVDGEPCYDFDPAQYSADDIITPLSRTFIPSRISDNPYLLGTGYMAQLQSLPEPLRSQMLKGDFTAGMEDDPWQVIPTAWVEAAMARWKARSPRPRMDSVGIDVARGGKDQTVISRRHGMWFDELLAYPGTQTPDGPTVAALVMANTRDNAPQHIDVIGVGASPFDFLNQAGQQVIGVNVAESATETDKSGRLGFANLRSQLWWKFREALDPANDTGIELPNDGRLLADLCAPRWKLQGKTIYVESREQIIERIGRSPDYASAAILALMDTPRMRDLPGVHTKSRASYDPYQSILSR
jgi:hypothetical protein